MKYAFETGNHCSRSEVRISVSHGCEHPSRPPGRVAAGECWRLWSRGFALEPQTPPELAGIELDDFEVPGGQSRERRTRVHPADGDLAELSTDTATVSVEEGCVQPD